MKHFIIGLALSLSIPLAGCATADFRTTSVKTVITADAAYIAASRAGMAAVVSGVLKKDRFMLLDNRAYAALLQVRAAKDNVMLFSAQSAFSASLNDLYSEAK